MKSRVFYIEKDILVDLYCNHKKTIQEIAKMYKCSKTPIEKMIKEYGIKTDKNKTINRTELVNLNKQYNKSEIAKIKDCSLDTMTRYFEIYNVVTSTKKDRIMFLGVKRCSCCKEFKTLDNFCYNKERADGFNKYCRECSSRKQKIIHNKNKKAQKIKLENRSCISCDIIKPINEFEKNTNIKTGYTNYCKFCANKSSNKRWHENDSYKERSKENRRKRREREVGLDYEYTIDHEESTKKNFDNMCFKCKSSRQLCIDHNYPLSLGYGLKLSNAVLLCRSCNASKGNRMPQDFYTKEELFKLNKILKKGG